MLTNRLMKQNHSTSATQKTSCEGDDGDDDDGDDDDGSEALRLGSFGA